MNQSSSSLEAGDLLTQGTPFITDTTNNRARRIVIGIEKAIPKVGGIAASITSLLWPKDPNKINIWDLIKEQVYEAIDKAILDQELFERKNELKWLNEWNTTGASINLVTPREKPDTMHLHPVLCASPLNCILLDFT